MDRATRGRCSSLILGAVAAAMSDAPQGWTRRPEDVPKRYGQDRQFPDVTKAEAASEPVRGLRRRIERARSWFGN